MTDDPRDEIIDPIAAVIHQIDQYGKQAELLARVMAADYHALTAAGVPNESAAIIVGQRCRLT